jgi:hypothetical protein
VFCRGRIDSKTFLNIKPFTFYAFVPCSQY